jgi:hypothetical protein
MLDSWTKYECMTHQVHLDVVAKIDALYEDKLLIKQFLPLL